MGQTNLSQDGGVRKLLRDYGITVLLAVAAALLIRYSLIEAYRIPTSAMRPALEPGDTIFVSKSRFELRLPGVSKPLSEGAPPERGEVVLFSMVDPDPEKGERHDFIKRVIGIPGDTVQLKRG